MSRIPLKTLSVLLLALLLATGLGAAYFFWRYPAVDPAPQIRVERSGAHVERGKYLASHVGMAYGGP